MKGRSIISNFLISQDLLRNYDRKGGLARCLMKIDLKKAYDSVYWGFIKTLMHVLNFYPKFVHWVRLCLSTARFSILVNG